MVYSVYDQGPVVESKGERKAAKAKSKEQQVEERMAVLASHPDSSVE